MSADVVLATILAVIGMVAIVVPAAVWRFEVRDGLPGFGRGERNR